MQYDMIHSTVLLPLHCRTTVLPLLPLPHLGRCRD